jgi:uncharacterized protein YjbJ (UPF0337 family)
VTPRIGRGVMRVGTQHYLGPFTSRINSNSRSRRWSTRIASKGSVEQTKGKAKELAGKVAGDKKTEAEGKADQVKGKVQNTVGGIKDSVRGQ